MFFSKLHCKIIGNKYYRWYITRHEREKKIRASLEKYYTGSQNKDFPENVVCIYDGGTQAGGLADRLKGIIGTYFVAKEKGIPFKLYFKNPFPLEDFFIPNSYDWQIDTDLVCKERKK